MTEKNERSFNIPQKCCLCIVVRFPIINGKNHLGFGSI